MGHHGASRDRAGPDAHLVVMETNSTLSGLEPLLGIEALAEYLEVPVTMVLPRSGPRLRRSVAGS
jgi:hypothetical protein